MDDLDRTRFPPRDTWLRLFERTPHARVYHHPDYVPAVFPDLGIPGFTVTCWQQHEPQGLAILIPKRLPFGRQVLPGAPSSLVGLRLAGFGLLGRDDPQMVTAIVAALAREMRTRHVAALELEELDESSRLWSSLQALTAQGFRFVAASDFGAHHHICLPATAEEYWKSFNSKRRNGLKKERERLQPYRVERYTLPSDVGALLEHAHTVSRKSWQTHQLGMRVRNSPEELRYLTFLATLGALRSYVLFRDEQPMAFVLSHQWRGVFHYDEVGFDRSLASLAPGKVLLMEILDDLFRSDRPERFDFGLGDGGYKQFFANRQTRSATLRMLAPGLKGAWLASSLRLRKSLTHRARQVMEWSGWYARLRRRRRDQAAQSGD